MLQKGLHSTFLIGILMVIVSHWAMPAEFIENLGQWNDNVAFKAEIPSGSLFLEKSGFTYSLLDMQPYVEAHLGRKPLPSSIQAHAFHVSFLNSNPNALVSAQDKQAHYRNYFIGKDPSKWASKVYSYSLVNYKDLYPGIDLKMYATAHGLKYDILISPNANPANVAFNYLGADSLTILPSGDLKITTSVMDIIEKRPNAFQTINGKRVEIACEFVLEDNRLSFRLPNGYDTSKELIIDPELIFSTYTGSTALNFGSSACYDSDGHLYGSGTTFGAGYPTTTGAYQINPGPNLGGTADIGISKFSQDGSNLIYSTYLGGSANETVHSTVVNAQGEVFILGTSVSRDFPTTVTALQDTNFGGQTVNWTTGYGMTYVDGCDMVISRLSSDGTQLLASTYLGGSENDGLNAGGLLDYNYGDPFRGEINVDATGNVYVASCTESNDFPITSGAAQTNLGGGRDGVITKLNPDLSALIWSTFVGGSSNDNAYAVQLSDAGEIAVAGGTESSNFPTSAGAHSTNYNGGVDGWVLKLAPDGSAFTSSTYVGSNEYDQVYFVQFDADQNVMVLGQTTGSIQITPNSVYSVPNSGQFIQKFSNDLTTLELSTTIGTGSGEVDISPTAFLVSNCNQIYISGWGGSTNNSNGNTVASTTNDLPITIDAFQPTTDGNDFYLMVLSEDAQALVYATYFGGDISDEHVDGGTSRFDKNGVVYQAVCAGCGNHDDFPTTPNAWSPTNEASCNLGVFKFDLNQIQSEPDFEVQLGNCEYPVLVDFTNNSSGANTFVWSFGDGSTADVFEDEHYYNLPGEYVVTLIARDSLDCLDPDTAEVSFIIPTPPSIEAFGTDTVCAEDTVQLGILSTDSLDYLWRPTSGLDDPTSANPLATITETTTYTVLATDSLGCQTEEEVTIYVSTPPGIEAGSDAYTQPGNPAQLLTDLPETFSLLWSPPDGLSCTACPNPLADPDETTTYYLEVTDELGCMAYDSLVVYVYPTLYVPNTFTPGTNTANPIFYVYGQGILDFSITIFNRWGQEVFNSENMNNGWDGTFHGRTAQQDVYVWQVSYTTDINPNRTIRRIGHVTLLRDMD